MGEPIGESRNFARIMQNKWRLPQWLRQCLAIVSLRRKRKRVLVVCAVAEEARHVEKCLLFPRYRTLCQPRRRCVRGLLEGAVVDVVTCGVGEVDASMVVTALMIESKPDLVLSVGCSGGHAKHVYPGDVVVSTAIVPTACKMLRSNGTSEHVGLRLNTTDPPVREIRTEPRLTEITLAAAAKMSLPAWPTTDGCRPSVYRGKIGSSDIWSQCPIEISRQHLELGTLCEEMEAFGIARVCHEFGVQFLCIKDIVNNELNPPAESDTETGLGQSLIMEELGKRAALIAVATIQELSAGYWRYHAQNV